ncbi:MAG: acetoacetate decarboxylase family protein, partial [Verrucomicrobia bacterium]|nr:acetoacetate decarboxylase family protein [Verrucomicrobiota bacterium]
TASGGGVTVMERAGGDRQPLRDGPTAGKAGPIAGSFLTVPWENLTDPIITGREALGFSKIYADLPEPVLRNGQTHCTASWGGFTFMELSVGELQPLSEGQNAVNAGTGNSAGTLHYKYMPRTGEPGRADVQYAVVTPIAVPNRVVKAVGRGDGKLSFHRARWEDMPTQYMIVNTLESLEIVEYRGATVAHTVGGKDLSDQQILLEP